MLKFIFWALLCTNAILFAYGQGYLGNFSGNEREPARIRNQLGTDKLKLVAPPPPAPAQPVPEPIPAAPLACIDIGNFTPAEARRFEARVAVLDLGARLTREDVASQEITSHIVFIPSQGSKEAAERKTAELQGMGVTSYFIMTDNSPMKWAISLGVFKSGTAAQTLLASLNKRGVTGVRIAGRGPQTKRAAYRLRGIDAGTRARFDGIKAGFPSQQVRNCK